MNHAGFVRRLQCLRDLLGDGEGLVHRDRPLRDPVGERGTFDQLEHERTGAVSLVFFSAVDLRDVRVVEAREDLRFPLEPGQPIGVGSEGVGEDLQRDIAAQLRVGGAIDLAHAALADEGSHVVMPQPRTDLEGHQLVYRVVRRRDSFDVRERSSFSGAPDRPARHSASGGL